MKRNTSVGVIVIGDIGRSPRMQYHAYSLTKEGFDVKLLGYNETPCNNELLKGVQLVHVEPPPPSLTSKFILRHSSCCSKDLYLRNFV